MPVRCSRIFLFISFHFLIFHNVITKSITSKNISKDKIEESTHEPEDIDEEVITSDEENASGFDLDEEEMIKFHIWPFGVIPYFIDDYSFDKVLRDTIRSFLDHINRLTGLKFVELLRPPEDGSRWVFFINRQGLLGCADHHFDSFTSAGVQKVLLGYDCINTDYGLSEIILSLVGVPPQHNAPNRDDFIIIHEKNVLPDKLQLFKKLRDDQWLFHDLNYDFKSAGHYDSHKYTINGGATISVQNDSSIEIGHGNCLSVTDINKIKWLYGYIARQKSKTRLHECNKMFSSGSNLKQYKPKLVELPPRKKPKKYLGIKDDSQTKLDELDKSNENKPNNTPKNDIVEDKKEPSESENPIKQESQDDEHGTPGSSKEIIDDEVDESHIKKESDRSKKLYKNTKVDQKILDLSDYRTYEV